MAEDLFPVPDLNPGTYHRTELIVKKSRFITSIGHTRGNDEAKAFIEKISKEFADARHNCFAFNADKPGIGAYMGYSDDGEPHGTAGQPMMVIIQHCGIGEICAVVTRYFGGILLGTGGLVRAYQDSVRQALESLPTTERMIASSMKLSIDHRYITLLLRLLPEYRADIVSSDFGIKADYEIILPAHKRDALAKALTEMTHGQAVITFKD